MKSLGRFLFVFALMSLPVFAQTSDITLFGGVHHPGKITLNNAASTGTSGASQIITDPADVGVFGARFGHGGLLGHESTIAYVPNFLDSDSKAVILNSNLRIQAPTPVIKPYGTAGLGTILSWGSGPGDLGGKFAINYGGGVKVMAGAVGLRADVRGYTVPSVQDQTLNIVEVSLGVVFGF